MRETILKEIVNTLEDPLAKKGFKLINECIFERINSKGQQEQYVIGLRKKRGSGYFKLHLVLKVLDSQYFKLYNEILKKTLTDSRYKFLPFLSKKEIATAIKIRTNRVELTTLTDWKSLKNIDESLDDFNKRFSIWLHSFDKLEEIEDWKQQLIISVNLIDKYFDNINSEYIINNSIGKLLPMFLLKDDQEKLELYYQKEREKMLSKNIEPFELDIFYEYLNNDNLI